MSDDHILEASAYLDGELSDDDRARVETDPDVMAVVTRFEAIRDQVRAVDPLDDARRDRFVAAALAATTTSESTISPGTNVVPLPARPGAGRWLSIAALTMTYRMFA